MLNYSIVHICLFYFYNTFANAFRKLYISVRRPFMSTASISKDFSIGSQAMADSLLNALEKSGRKSKWTAVESSRKASDIQRINKLFAK